MAIVIKNNTDQVLAYTNDPLTASGNLQPNDKLTLDEPTRLAIGTNRNYETQTLLSYVFNAKQDSEYLLDGLKTIS